MMTASDSRLVLALASGQPITEAAQQVGISKRTVHRRMNDPEFCRELDRVRAELTAEALDRLAHSATKAADTLEELLSAESPRIRLQASKALLELVAKAAVHAPRPLFQNRRQA